MAVKNQDFVNMQGFRLELELAQAMQGILASIPWLRNWTVDSSAVHDVGWDLLVENQDGSPVFIVECKKELSPSQFLSLMKRDPILKGAIRVLAMPRISPRMAELCQVNGWGWYDLAGNCHFEIPGTLLIERTGREPVKICKSTEVNLGNPEAGRVVRALLAPENAGKRWTQRGIEDHFDGLSVKIPAPSLGLVNKVVKFLRDQAMVENTPERGFRLCDPLGLLNLWTSAYRFERHVRRRYFTLLRDQQVHMRLLELRAQRGLAYGAFSAANLQAPSVRQPRTWIYATPEMESILVTILEAKSVDTGDNLVLLLPEDVGVFYGLDLGPEHFPCTNAVQTYADLRHVGGRGDEAAEAILTQRLQPAWKEIITHERR